MSRSGYSYGLDNWALIRWRGAVASAIGGKRGQKLLRDLRDALDAMPVKELIASDLECDDGVCALGALGRQRGIDMSGLDPYDPSTVAGTFGIADALAQEIVHENDEGTYQSETPAQRWQRMRRWVDACIEDDA